MNKDANSASAADNMTYFMILAIVKIALLKYGIGTFSDIYMWILAQLRALGLLR